jgi:hypothetical protein
MVTASEAAKARQLRVVVEPAGPAVGETAQVAVALGMTLVITQMPQVPRLMGWVTVTVAISP